MNKIRTAFFCSNCGHETTKWLGKCPNCEQWNTFVEEVITKDNKLSETDWKKFSSEKKEIKTISISEVISGEEKRIVSSDVELNRVLGGGIVAGSLVLIAGEPGIGKSTLFLQNGLLLKNITTLYISGEESEQQIKMRADRLKIQNENFYVLTETSTQIIFQEIKKLKPQLVIVDSIQTLQSSYIESSPGSVSQIRRDVGTDEKGHLSRSRSRLSGPPGAAAARAHPPPVGAGCGCCDFGRFLWLEFWSGRRWLRRYAGGACGDDPVVRRSVFQHC